MKQKPEVGDYIILDLSGKYGVGYFPYIRNFTDEHVGKVIDYDPSLDCKYLIDYDVKLMRPYSEEYPEKQRPFFPHRFETGYIVYWSKNKEDCELRLSANKYNL